MATSLEERTIENSTTNSGKFSVIYEHLDRFFCNHPNIFFVQNRVGKGGRSFHCYKSRTMKHGADLPDHRKATGKNGTLFVLRTISAL